jgi:hypothetical protein
VSSKEGMIPKKKNCEFLAEIFFCCGRLYGFGIEIEAIFWHSFRGDFHIFNGCFGSYRTVCTMGCGHEKMRYGRGWTTV